MENLFLHGCCALGYLLLRICNCGLEGWDGQSYLEVNMAIMFLRRVRDLVGVEFGLLVGGAEDGDGDWEEDGGED